MFAVQGAWPPAPGLFADSPFVAPRRWLTLSDAVQRLLQTPIEAFSQWGTARTGHPVEPGKT